MMGVLSEGRATFTNFLKDTMKGKKEYMSDVGNCFSIITSLKVCKKNCEVVSSAIERAIEEDKCIDIRELNKHAPTIGVGVLSMIFIAAMHENYIEVLDSGRRTFSLGFLKRRDLWKKFLHFWDNPRFMKFLLLSEKSIEMFNNKKGFLAQIFRSVEGGSGLANELDSIKFKEPLIGYKKGIISFAEIRRAMMERIKDSGEMERFQRIKKEFDKDAGELGEAKGD